MFFFQNVMTCLSRICSANLFSGRVFGLAARTRRCRREPCQAYDDQAVMSGQMYAGNEWNVNEGERKKNDLLP